MAVKKVILTITSVIATAAVAAGIFAGAKTDKPEAVRETTTAATLTAAQTKTTEADRNIGKPDYDALKKTAEKCGDDVYYIFNEENGELFIFGTGAMDNCTHLNFAPWAELDVTSVRIADGVTTIGEGAFQYLSNLKSIYIPDSVTMIMYNAFCDCENLTSINIPESVTYIGGGAFAGCTSLKGITLPQSLTTGNHIDIVNLAPVIFTHLD